jgi:hypothetical protein
MDRHFGQRSVIQRVAHVSCECPPVRPPVSGMSRPNVALPLTQVDLGDAMWMSPVHVNRVLQELRGLNLIAFGDKRLRYWTSSALRSWVSSILPVCTCRHAIEVQRTGTSWR